MAADIVYVFALAEAIAAGDVEEARTAAGELAARKVALAARALAASASAELRAAKASPSRPKVGPGRHEREAEDG